MPNSIPASTPDETGATSVKPVNESSFKGNDLTELRRLQRLAKLKKNYGLLFYNPFPKQDMFHANGHFLRRYVRTGNRFGKSTLGAAEDCAWAIGERPWYPEGDPRRTAGIPRRPTKGLIIVADWDKAKEIFTNRAEGAAQGKLFKFLPKDSIGKCTSNSGIIVSIEVKSIHGGWSTIYIDTVKSYKANPMGQESSDWDWIHVDEPCPKDMWIANSRGLIDRQGSAWFTCTPINEPWINDMFIPRKAMRKEVSGAIQMDDDHWMITGSSYDNPYNTEKALKMFEKDLTEEEKQCRIGGIPLALSGLVYKEFNPDVHVLTKLPTGWQSWMHPPESYTHRIFIDPHPQTPHAVLFAATSPYGPVYYWHEIFRKCLIPDLCDMINEIMMGYEIADIFCDPSAFVQSPVDDMSMADCFLANGLNVQRAPKDLSRGIIEAQAFLGARMRTPLGTVVPKAFFSPHLSETLWEFDHYMWSSTRKDKPVDKDDHMMENFYRSVITDHSFITQSSVPSAGDYGYSPKLNVSLKC